MCNEELQYWVALNNVDGLGPVHFRRLLKHLGGVEAAWKASVSDLNPVYEAIDFTQKVVSQCNSQSFSIHLSS